MSSPRTLRSGAMVVALAAAVAGCSSSSSSHSSSAAPAATTGPSAGPLPAASGPVPDVAHATDLKVAPVPGPGTPPAPTALAMKDLVVGSGPAALPSSTVSVQYVGTNYADGKAFDSSWQRGQAADFPLSGVIPGFAKGIAGMKVGGRRELVIPPDLGYGAAGAPPAVGPNETLVFVIDLVGVK